MERVKRKALINDEWVESDFMKGDRIREKHGHAEGIVEDADSIAVIVDWIDENEKKKRGRRWSVTSVERI